MTAGGMTCRSLSTGPLGRRIVSSRLGVLCGSVREGGGVIEVGIDWAEDHHDVAVLDRRIREGKCKKEVIRCLKRYVAREVFAVLHP
jgi:hypothetical protein